MCSPCPRTGVHHVSGLYRRRNHGTLASCHPERSEESRRVSETLRFAQSLRKNRLRSFIRVAICLLAAMVITSKAATTESSVPVRQTADPVIPVGRPAAAAAVSPLTSCLAQQRPSKVHQVVG